MRIPLSAEYPQFPLTSAPCRTCCCIWMYLRVSALPEHTAWFFSLITCSPCLPGVAKLCGSAAATLGGALQTESDGFYFSCSPNMQSKFNYMLSHSLCYIFFHLLVLSEIHIFYMQRLLVSVHCPWKHLWLILPSACVMQLSTN